MSEWLISHIVLTWEQSDGGTDCWWEMIPSSHLLCVKIKELQHPVVKCEPLD